MTETDSQRMPSDDLAPVGRRLSDPRFISITPADLGLVAEQDAVTTVRYRKPAAPPLPDRPTIRHHRLTGGEVTTLRVPPRAAR